MRRSRVVVVVAFVIFVFMVFFYPTIYSVSTEFDKEVDEKLGAFKEESHKLVSFPEVVPSLNMTDFTISQDFRGMIPQNNAYWNKELHIALSNLDNNREIYENTSHWQDCGQRNEDKLKTNIGDYNSYPALIQTFVRAINCKSPPLLIDQPDLCYSRNGEDKVFLLFGIKSNPANFQERQVVRETWGRKGMHTNGVRVQLVFLLGSSSSDDPDLSVLLSYEANFFGDLLQWDFHDSFLNLTLKMHKFLEWTQKHCPQASFIFSGDDDVFINTPLLLTYLQSLKAPESSRMYIGQIIYSASPHRNPQIKYYVPLSFYDGPYPPYAGGGGFVFSGALVPSLYLASHVIPFYPIDDVYMAMLLKALKVSPEAHSGFQTFDVRAEDRQNVCVHKSYVLIHKRSPREMKTIWNAMLSPTLKC